MRLKLTSLGRFVALHEDVQSLRAEDASGSFGIRPGHADLLTTLEVGVLSWRLHDGSEQHCAVRRGVLRVTGGELVEVASREAIIDTGIETLESTVLAAFHARDEAEHSLRTEAQRFELQALRELMRYLQPDHQRGPR